jgi:hypothetical protein
MDVVGHALAAEARAEVFRLRCRVRYLEQREADLVIQKYVHLARIRELETELRQSKKKGAVWVDRTGSTPELDAHITRLTNHVN